MRIAVTLALTSGLACMAAPITFSDSNFSLASYTILQGISNGTLSFSSAGGAFQANQALNAGSGFANFAAMNSAFAYNPTTMGTLNSIAVSALVTTPGSPWALYVQQGSNLYRVPVTTPTGTTPQLSSASGIVAASFALVNLAAGTVTAGTPNFGAPFILGFGQRLVGSGPYSQSIVFDDLTITLDVTPNAGSEIPEPGTFVLVAAGALLAVVGARTRR